MLERENPDGHQKLLWERGDDPKMEDDVLMRGVCTKNIFNYKFELSLAFILFFIKNIIADIIHTIVMIGENENINWDIYSNVQKIKEKIFIIIQSFALNKLKNAVNTPVEIQKTGIEDIIIPNNTYLLSFSLEFGSVFIDMIAVVKIK